MPPIQPLPALRHNLAPVGRLSALVPPPYDVTPPALQSQLHDLSPYNVVRLELGLDHPGDSDQSNRYTRAADLLRQWRRDAVLLPDKEPSLYVYDQTFDLKGRSFPRRGFMARVRLERFGEGRIYPHEETMPGPKAARPRLMPATGLNISQIFGLFPADAGEVPDRLRRAVGQQPPLEATDHL